LARTTGPGTRGDHGEGTVRHGEGATGRGCTVEKGTKGGQGCVRATGFRVSPRDQAEDRGNGGTNGRTGSDEIAPPSPPNGATEGLPPDHDVHPTNHRGIRHRPMPPGPLPLIQQPRRCPWSDVRPPHHVLQPPTPEETEDYVLQRRVADQRAIQTKKKKQREGRDMWGTADGHYIPF
jgi:hypothetical protein